MRRSTCAGCDMALPPPKRPGRPREWCSPQCRAQSKRRLAGIEPKRPRKRLTCAGCAREMHCGPMSLPQGQAVCLPCRKARPAKTKPSKKSECPDCGIPCWGVRCRPCNTKLRTTVFDGEKVERARRDRAAPGLSIHARSLLLKLWIKQGRRCAYCLEQVANTIDHVVPLIRGGTNYEGNLAPCCRPCNSRKGGRTVAEWRHKRRPSRRTMPGIDTQPVREPDYTKRTCSIHFGTCEQCGEAWSSRSRLTRMCPAHRGWTPISERIRPCVDCAAPVAYLTRPLPRCERCAASHAKARGRAYRREHRRIHGKGKCMACGGPRWGKRWCQRCYDVVAGGAKSFAA